MSTPPPAGPATPRRWLPFGLVAGGVLFVALLASASGGIAAFLSVAGLGAVVVAIVALVRGSLSSLALKSRSTAGITLAAGVAVMMTGGGVGAATSPPPASEPRSFVVVESSSPAAPKPTVETVTETETIPYGQVTVEDATLAVGTSTVTTAGVDGVRTISYEVTMVEGVETSRMRLGEQITTAPIDEVTTVGTLQPRAPAPSNDCHPSYTPCVPIASDVDCAGGSGNGPAYVRGPITVIGPDVYDLDRNRDGVACE